MGIVFRKIFIAGIEKKSIRCRCTYSDLKFIISFNYGDVSFACTIMKLHVSLNHFKESLVAT